MPLDPLSQLPEEPTTQIPLEFYERRPQPEATAAFLTVLSGANVGMTFPLARGGVLGRSHRADIQLLDHAVSRQHCRLEREDEGYVLTDLESLNGTYVNGERISRVLLKDGDRIQVGASTLKFAYYDAAEEAFFLQMATAALHDPLTGLHNRRFFLEQLELEIPFALRHQIPLHVLYLDLDGFKQINDRWGHWAGDQTLIQVARRLQAHVRQDDLVARLGGDEFALLVRGIPNSQILGLAERLRQAVQTLLVQAGTETISLSCSVGIASLLELGEGTDPQSLLAAADKALYQAKAEGGNRETLL
jgi:diguanylate cyclase (GGDEF)-like protein